MNDSRWVGDFSWGVLSLNACEINQMIFEFWRASVMAKKKILLWFGYFPASKVVTVNGLAGSENRFDHSSTTGTILQTILMAVTRRQCGKTISLVFFQFRFPSNKTQLP